MSVYDFLLWPEGVPRSKTRDLPVTAYHYDDAIKLLTGILIDFGDVVGKRVENIVITLSRAQTLGADQGVAVYFDLGGSTYCLTCDRFDSVSGNLCALYYSIVHLIKVTGFSTRHTIMSLMAGFAVPRPDFQQDNNA